MLGNQRGDWRARRRADATAEIVRVAWELAREHGLAGLTLRDLARRLGMAAPSLYSYVDSKHALYDAMFADGWQAAIDFEPHAEPSDLRTTLRAGMDRWMRFALADPVRYQLLSQRTIPGFEPSPESYAVAQRAYAESFAPLIAVVPLTQAELDLITGFAAGLINQQISNDPGGTRWVRLLDPTVDLLVHHIERAHPAAPRRRPPRKKEAR